MRVLSSDGHHLRVVDPPILINKKWRFKDPAIVVMLRNKFPAIYVEPDVDEELLGYVKEQEIQKVREVKAKEIKEGKVSNIKIKGMNDEFIITLMLLMPNPSN